MGRLVDKETLLKYLNQQPEQKLKILVVEDKESGEVKIIETHQTGSEPPIVVDEPSKNKLKGTK